MRFECDMFFWIFIHFSCRIHDFFFFLLVSRFFKCVCVCSQFISSSFVVHTIFVSTSTVLFFCLHSECMLFVAYSHLFHVQYPSAHTTFFDIKYIQLIFIFFVRCLPFFCSMLLAKNHCLVPKMQTNEKKSSFFLSLPDWE